MTFVFHQTNTNYESRFYRLAGISERGNVGSYAFEASAKFPKEEKFSLTDQVRRSSRSVCRNLAESHAKRRYPKHFYAKLTDALGENYETLVWLRFARLCRYIDNDSYTLYADLNAEVGKLLNYMIKHPEQLGLHQNLDRK